MVARAERAVDEVALVQDRTSSLTRVARRFWRHKGAVVGGLVLALLILVAIGAPIIAPYKPDAISNAILSPPSYKHLLGTDNFGRDILSRLIYGSRYSLSMGFVAIAIALVIGSLIGVLGGTYRGLVDEVLMRIVDALMAFPGILMALAVTTVLGPGLFNAMIAVGIAFVPSFARLVRSSVLQVRELPYVESARAAGCGTGRLIRRHILPNVLTPILVLSTLGIASAILIGAGLSFLGLGVQPPTPEWGAMLSDGQQYMAIAWWVMAFPGLAITVTVVAANMVGDGLRDALDPRLKI